MQTLQLSKTENVWLDEENGTIQFWSGKTEVEYPIEFGLAILDFLKKHEDKIDEYVIDTVLTNDDDSQQKEEEKE